MDNSSIQTGKANTITTSGLNPNYVEPTPCLLLTKTLQGGWTINDKGSDTFGSASKLVAAFTSTSDMLAYLLETLMEDAPSERQSFIFYLGGSLTASEYNALASKHHWAMVPTEEPDAVERPDYDGIEPARDPVDVPVHNECGSAYTPDVSFSDFRFMDQASASSGPSDTVVTTFEYGGPTGDRIVKQTVTTTHR